MKIKKITMESEFSGPIIGGEEFTNDNQDVLVEMENGETYVATFFTYENVEHLRTKNQKTGECLNGKYFWSSDMIIIERLDRISVEQVIEDLIESEYFESVFTKESSEEFVWIFNGQQSSFSGGVFKQLGDAEYWIKRNRLTGMLTKYPLDIGVFDWANENDLINTKSGSLKEKIKDPIFVGGFTSASMEHYHYENGEKE